MIHFCGQLILCVFFSGSWVGETGNEWEGVKFEESDFRSHYSQKVLYKHISEKLFKVSIARDQF